MAPQQISALAESILAVVGLLGLYQLVIAKKAITTNVKRESVRLAVEQAKFFMREIIPSMDECYIWSKNIPELSIREKEIDLVDFTMEEVLSSALAIEFIRIHKWQRMQAEKGETDFILRFLRPMNDLESFATSFTTGAADESAAFGSVGLSYVNSVTGWYYQYCSVRSKEKSYKPFSNTIDLYNLWSGRIKKTRLSKIRAELEEKIKNVESGRNIKPIGLN